MSDADPGGESVGRGDVATDEASESPPDHLLQLGEWTPDALAALFDRAGQLKRAPFAGGTLLENRSLLMLFAEPSTRTRLSFAVGMTQLGGHAVPFDRSASQLSRGESLADTARVASRYVDGVLCRLPDHGLLEGFADAATVPVVNGLTDRFHPCQGLADAFTLHELECDSVAFVGDGGNVCHSLLQAATLAGLDCRVATPEGYEPDVEVVDRARENPGAVTATTDPPQAVAGADAVYTDVWASMHHEDREGRVENFREAGFQVDDDLLERAAADAVFMHCLPAHRGEEVTADVLDGFRSVVYRQAENRLHVQKAALLRLLGE